MSPEFKKEIFDGCYLDAKSTLGNQRAKQYCTCTSEMLHRKFSDEEILRIGQKSQNEQTQAFSFASNILSPDPFLSAIILVLLLNISF